MEDLPTFFSSRVATNGISTQAFITQPTRSRHRTCNTQISHFLPLKLLLSFSSNRHSLPLTMTTRCSSDHSSYGVKVASTSSVLYHNEPAVCHFGLITLALPNIFRTFCQKSFRQCARLCHREGEDSSYRWQLVSTKEDCHNTTFLGSVFSPDRNYLKM